MRLSDAFFRHRFIATSLLAAITCASCAAALRGGALPSAALLPRKAAAYRILHRFRGVKDGIQPSSGLTYVNGVFYGTTAVGGTGCSPKGGCGTVFSIDRNRRYRVIYSFKGDRDGAIPNGDLVYRNGWLYGVTYSGGGVKCGVVTCGTIFAVSTRGEERILYRFTGKYNGGNPVSGLTDVNGTLYGTTPIGGKTRRSEGGGVVFATGTTPNSERVLYKFKGGVFLGGPGGPLLWKGGTLIGTAGTDYIGAIFTLTPAGSEKTVYKSQRGEGGPRGPLLEFNGTFYAISGGGGGYDCTYCGTVIAISPAGVQHVVWSFHGGSDGENPEGALIGVAATLYGTTGQGGKFTCNGGCGTVFSLTPSGQQLVVYRFRGGRDGAGPDQRLVMVDGVLYGTTRAGGSRNCSDGCGTIFAVTP